MTEPAIYIWSNALHDKVCTTPIVCQVPYSEMLDDDGLLVPKKAYIEPYSGIPSQRSKADSVPCYVRYDRSYVIFWLEQKISLVSNLDENLLPEVLSKLDIQVIKDTLSILGLRAIKK